MAIVPEALTGANITQGTARFRPSRIISTEYLAIALEAPQTQAWLHSHYRGIDMPGLNLADVRRVPIPLPPIEEQFDIVRRVKIQFAALEVIANSCVAALEKTKLLTPSLLGKAFRGELVPQDQSDEPASSLLERIRADRADAQTKSKRSRATRRRKKVTKFTFDSLKKMVSEMPQEHFTFDELRARVSVDYESLRDAVFSLLADPDSELKQGFDSATRQVRFIRKKS